MDAAADEASSGALGARKSGSEIGRDLGQTAADDLERLDLVLAARSLGAKSEPSHRQAALHAERPSMVLEHTGDCFRWYRSPAASDSPV